MNMEKCEKILDTTVDGKNIFGSVVTVRTADDEWTGARGNIAADTQYFIASTTKLYLTAILLQLREKQLLQFSDTIATHLPEEVVNGLHIYKGTDYSRELTIEHLMSHTSGLPDYFEDKNEDGKSLLRSLTEGNDQAWSFEDVLRMSKNMKPLFCPGKKGKAHYSDTNYQLLEKIIERVTGKDMAVALNEMIFTPLQLTHTYLYTNPADTSPIDIYYKDQALHIPKAMSSFRGDGGIVSTAKESMIFLQAFFSGKLFSADILPHLYQWNKIMFPLEYGTGIMRFRLPKPFSFISSIPPLIGHSGLSGAFAFYAPEKNVYVAGTVNQIHKPGRSFTLMSKILQTVC